MIGQMKKIQGHFFSSRWQSNKQYRDFLPDCTSFFRQHSSERLHKPRYTEISVGELSWCWIHGDRRRWLGGWAAGFTILYRELGSPPLPTVLRNGFTTSPDAGILCFSKFSHPQRVKNSTIHRRLGKRSPRTCCSLHNWAAQCVLPWLSAQLSCRHIDQNNKLITLG